MPVPATPRGRVRAFFRYPHRDIAAVQLVMLTGLAVAALLDPRHRRGIAVRAAVTLLASETALVWRAEVARREATARKHSFELLTHVTEALADPPSRDDALLRAAQVVVASGEADWCAIDVAERGRLERPVEYANKSRPAPPAATLEDATDALQQTTLTGPIGRVFLTGQPLYEPAVSPWFAELNAGSSMAAAVERYGLRSVIAVPIQAYRQTLGVLSVGLWRDDVHFCREDVPVFYGIATRVGMTLTVATLRDRVTNGIPVP